MIFPNPNAPTGIAQDLSDIEDILQHNQDVVVIVDEAYIDFGGHSALELIDRYENLLVVQIVLKITFACRYADRICFRKQTADQVSERCEIFF